MNAINDVLTELNAALDSYLEASARLQDARREETAATNRLNLAQRAVDTAVAEIRKGAPNGSDWSRKTVDVIS
jgi:hypothetical protein